MLAKQWTRKRYNAPRTEDVETEIEADRRAGKELARDFKGGAAGPGHSRTSKNTFTLPKMCKTKLESSLRNWTRILEFNGTVIYQ